MATDIDESRLPTNVRPTHYDLSVRTDLEKKTFNGVVVIHLDVERETKTLTFNASGLALSDISLESDGSSHAHESQASGDGEHRTTLTYATAFPAGASLRLRIAFAGALSGDGDSKGYYASDAGACAVTQFHPDAAHRVFPCWDEPALKATFALTLVVPAGAMALSTMSVLPSTPDTLDGALAQLSIVDPEKWTTTRFVTTPPMSTYHLAWTIGPMNHAAGEYSSPVTGSTIPLGIYSPTAGNFDDMQFALDVLRKALPVYETLLDVPYPLPKLDLLLVADHDDGVLETSWGLIVGTPDEFTVNIDAPPGAKKAVVTAICRALAQQWFGALVSLAWWDTLYLNVGIASLLGALVVPARLFPDWGFEPTFVQSYVQGTLTYDGKRSAQPLEAPTPSAGAADAAFDALRWNKSGAVLRMLLLRVGEGAFLRGVTSLLRARRHGSATSADLWRAIAEAAGEEVGPMMRAWTAAPGCPCLVVTETRTGIRVRQARFVDTGAAAEDDGVLWEVPLRVRTADDGDRVVVLRECELDIPLGRGTAYALNTGNAALVRVAYPPERLANLADDPLFGPAERVALIADAAALARAGYMRTSAALALAAQLHGDTQPQVWDALDALTGAVRDVWFENASVSTGVRAFRRALFAPLVERVGLDPQEEQDGADAQLRQTAIRGAASSDDPAVIAELRRRFAAGEVSDQVRTAAYSAAVRHGGREEFDAVRKILDDAPARPEKIAAVIALCSAPNSDWVREILQHALEHARTEDIELVVYGASVSPSSRRLLAGFFKAHYAAFAARFGASFTFQHVVRDAFVRLASEKDADETAAFFADKDTKAFASVLRQTVDTIRSAAQWIERSTADVEEWLVQRGQ